MQALVGPAGASTTKYPFGRFRDLLQKKVLTARCDPIAHSLQLLACH